MSEPSLHEAGVPEPAAKRMVGGFEVLEEIGRGGMAVVFKARQVSVDRTVALKILPPHLASNNDYVKRFLREARSVAHLSHPHVVQAIDAGHAGAYYYYAMEFVDGESAGALLERKGVVPERRALEIVRDIARALEHVHEAGIVHRDVKPGNILIAKNGTAKLADLGLARVTTKSQTTLTQTGMMLGTPNYISPEQVRGEATLDGRADIYALGATLFHLVTGRPAHPGDTGVEVMYKHLHDPVPDATAVNPAVSAGTAAIIRKMMAKNPGERYQTAGELLRDIGRRLSTRMAAGVRGAGEIAPGARVRADAPTPATASLVTAPTTELPTPTPLPRGTTPLPVTKKRWTGPVLAIAAAGGVMVLVVVAAVVLPKLRGKPREQKRPGTAAVATTRPAAVSDDEKVLAYVQKWVKEHPGEYLEGIKKYERAMEEVKTPLLRMQMADTAAELRKEYEAMLNEAFEKIDGPARTMAETGDYDGAIAEYGKLPKELPQELGARAKRAAEALKTEAEAKIKTALAEADKLSDAGEPEKGLTELDKLKDVKYAVLADDVAKMRTHIEEEGKNAEEVARKKAATRAKEAVAKLLDDIEAAAMAGNLAECGRLAAEAERDEKLKLAEAELRPAVAVGKALARAVEAKPLDPVEALKTFMGKDENGNDKEAVLPRKSGQAVKGKLVEVRPDRAVVEYSFKINNVPTTRRIEVPIAEIDPVFFEPFKPKWEAKTADEQIAAAVLAVKAQEAGALEAALAAAKDHPLAGRYTEKLAKFKANALEVAAQKAWDENLQPWEARQTMSVAEGEKVLALVTAFEEKYGATKFAESKREQITKLQGERAEAAARTAWEKIRHAADRTGPAESELERLARALDEFGHNYGKTAFAVTVEAELELLRDKARTSHPELRFESKLELTVCTVQYLEDGGLKSSSLGTTPTKDGQGVVVPAGALWYVRPTKLASFGEKEFRDLAAELKRKRVPGVDLSVPNGSPTARKVAEVGLPSIAGLADLKVLFLALVEPVTDDMLTHIASFRRLEVATFTHSGGRPSVTGFARIGGLTELRYLDLNNCGVTDAGMEQLRPLTKLRCLKVSAITDAGLKCLTGMNDLRQLYLLYTQVTDQGLGQLNQLRRLRALVLSASITGSGLADMTGAARLERIYFGSEPTAAASVTDVGLAAVSSFGRLKALGLPRCPKVTDAGLAHLEGLGELEVLDVSGCKQVTDAGLAHLKDLALLTSLNVSATRVTDAGLAHLKDLKRLTSLDIARTEVTDAALKHLRNTSLRTLEYAGTKVTPDAAKALLEVTKQNAAQLKAAGDKAEKDAADAWAAIRRAGSRTTLTDSQAAAVGKALDKFEADYGKTAFAGTVEKEISALRAKVQAALRR